MKADQRTGGGKLRMPTTMNYQTMSEPKIDTMEVKSIKLLPPTHRDTYLGAEANLIR